MEDSTELDALRDEVVQSSGLFAEHTFGHGVFGVTRHGLGVTGFGTNTS